MTDDMHAKGEGEQQQGQKNNLEKKEERTEKQATHSSVHVPVFQRKKGSSLCRLLLLVSVAEDSQP